METGSAPADFCFVSRPRMFRPFYKVKLMNDYEVTYANGDVVVITAWTPEAALVIAEEDAELYGYPGMEAVSAGLLDSHAAEA